MDDNKKAGDLLEKESESAEELNARFDRDFNDEEKSLFKSGNDDEIPYHSEKSKTGLLSRARSKFKEKGTKKRTGIIVLGTSGVALIGIILLMLFFISSLKLQNLAAHITVWNMARSARSWRQNISRVTEEQIATETMDESRYNQYKARFNETKVGAAVEKVNSYRPAVVLNKMNDSSKPIFRETGERKFLKFLGPKKEFVGWDIDGATIEKTNSRFFHPIENYRDKLRLSADAQAAFERKFPDTNSLVRNKAVKNWLKARDIKLFGWRQRGEKFKGLTREAAAAHEAEIASKERRTPPGPCKVASTCETSKAATDAADQKLTEIGEDPEIARNANEIGDKVSDASGESIKGGSRGLQVQSALSKASFAYAVAVPLCLIYEGSINSSPETIDNSETSLVKGYFDVQSSADQQKAGEVTSEALQAKADKYGLIGESIPERRARDAPVDTIAETNPAALPQASSTGSYTLFDAYLLGFMNQATVDFLNSIVGSTCPKITSLGAGVAATLAELGLLIFSGTSSKLATESAKVGFSKLLARVTERLVIKEVEGQIVATGARVAAGNLLKIGGKFALKTGLYVGGTFTLTELAKMSVLKHSNLENSGLATDSLAADQADMGGNIYGNTVMKEINKGAPMTTPEVAMDKTANIAYLKQQNKQKSPHDRYFALSNPDSLVSKVGMLAVSSLTVKNLFTKITLALSNPLPRLATMFSFLTPAKVSAAETVKGAGEYNIVQWGYTQEENQLIDNDEEYAPIMNELILDSSGRSKDIEDKYGKCFSETNGTVLSKGWIKRNDDGSVISDDSVCSPINLGLHNPNFGDLVFRWRLKHRYDNTLGYLKDIQNVQVAP